MCVYVLYLDKVYSLARAKARRCQDRAGDTAAPTDSSSQCSRQSAPAAADPRTNLANTALHEPPPSSSPPEPHVPQPPPAAEGTPHQPGLSHHDPPGAGGRRRDRQAGPPDSRTEGVGLYGLAGWQAAKDSACSSRTPANASARSVESARRLLPKLPPNTYSNHPNAATADSWTIVLFDLLNTPTDRPGVCAQAIARDAAHRAQGAPGRAIPSDQPADDDAGLHRRSGKAAAGGREPDALRRSHVLTTEAERQQEEGQITHANAELTASAPAGTTRQPRDHGRQMTRPSSNNCATWRASRSRTVRTSRWPPLRRCRERCQAIPDART